MVKKLIASISIVVLAAPVALVGLVGCGEYRYLPVFSLDVKNEPLLILERCDNPVGEVQPVNGGVAGNAVTSGGTCG